MALAQRFCKRLERPALGLKNTSVFLDQARSTTDQSTRSTYFAKAGVNHYARLSSLGADPNGKDSVSRVHGQAEQDLEKSGLSYTHIRANYFMQMFLSQAENFSQQNGFAICAVGSAEVGFIETRDISATAAAVLSNDG